MSPTAANVNPELEGLNPIARELGTTLQGAAPEVWEMLSPLGRRLYFPKGILSQTAEAKEKAKRFNATIGIATEGVGPMVLPSVLQPIQGIPAADVVNYAPPAGRQALRERWREKLIAENPSLKGKKIGLPIVTSAITHGLAIAGDLFVAPGDVILLPDKLWGNYRLTFEIRLGARIATFPFYAGNGFDTAGFASALEAQGRERQKLLVLLNFPNNPTGYMPTPREGEEIVAALVRQAERGTRVVAIFDDAYTGLFYHLGQRSMTESLFGQAVGRHPNLLSVRLDGATKELFVWGLRCGFITFGPGRADTADTVCTALDAKVRGAIRGAVSNGSMLSQSLVERALASSTLDAERKQKHETLRARAEKVYEVVAQPRFRDAFEPYPFNSGYFMCIRAKGVDGEAVRLHLLDRYGIGLIATGGPDLRIAFSCLELGDIEPMFEGVAQAIRELQSKKG
jgi:aspartate/methionine/tyrosine aminotransferase